MPRRVSQRLSQGGTGTNGRTPQYDRLRRRRYLVFPGAPPGVADRLVARLVKSYRTGCWLWTGPKRRRGYGAIWHSGKTVATHRLALELATRQPVPADALVIHSCDQPACCNPKHLRVGTHKDNHADMVAKGRLPVQPPRIVKLSYEKAVEIRAQHAAGTTKTALARRYGVALQSIGDVISCRSYKPRDQSAVLAAAPARAKDGAA